jgi:hypothetical protein
VAHFPSENPRVFCDNIQDMRKSFGQNVTVS